MDIRMKHIKALSKPGCSQSRFQTEATLYFIHQFVVSEDIRGVLRDEDYEDHLKSLNMSTCNRCTVPVRYGGLLCEDCKIAEEEAWRDHQEEVGNAHMVSVGRG